MCKWKRKLISGCFILKEEIDILDVDGCNVISTKHLLHLQHTGCGSVQNSVILAFIGQDDKIY